MMNKIATFLIGLVPASTIASIVAKYVTKALQNIKDKDKLAKISDAVASAAKAVTTIGEAVKDGEITEDEVNQVAADVEVAAKAVMDAAK